MKVITSPVTKFPGTVGIKDPIPLSACVEWEAGLAECQPSPCSEGRVILNKLWREQIVAKKDASDEEKAEVEAAEIKRRAVVSDEYETHFVSCTEKGNGCKLGLTDIEAQARMLKAIRACVETWEVPNFDLVNPPGSPKIARSQFIGWLIGEINKIYNEAEAAGDPNA